MIDQYVEILRAIRYHCRTSAIAARRRGFCPSFSTVRRNGPRLRVTRSDAVEAEPVEHSLVIHHEGLTNMEKLNGVNKTVYI